MRRLGVDKIDKIILASAFESYILTMDKRAEADKVDREMEYVELTVEPSFDRVFSEAMWFPHMKDSFPIWTISSRER